MQTFTQNTMKTLPIPHTLKKNSQSLNIESVRDQSKSQNLTIELAHVIFHVEYNKSTLNPSTLRRSIDFPFLSSHLLGLFFFELEKLSEPSGGIQMLHGAFWTVFYFFTKEKEQNTTKKNYKEKRKNRKTNYKVFDKKETVRIWIPLFVSLQICYFRYCSLLHGLDYQEKGFSFQLLNNLCFFLLNHKLISLMA